MSTSPNNQSTGNTKPPSKRAENTPTPSEFLGIIFNWLRHWWDAPHEKSKPADWAMVGLTIIIAVTAFWSICVFEGQLKEARRATDLSEKQWHLDHMPWLAIENNTLGIRPKPIAS